MRFIMASVSLGFFTWLSYMVFTGRFAPIEDDAEASGVLEAVLGQSAEALGVNETSLALLGLGALLSFGIIAFGPRSDDL